MKNFLLTLFIGCLMVGYTTQSYAQDTLVPYVRYSFRINGIEEYREAKPIWNEIRYFFNFEGDPFRYRLDLEGGLFSITLPRVLSEEVILNHFNSKNIVLTKLNILHYE
jgi:hypothetical protein